MYHSVFTGIFSNTADTVIITQLNCRVTHVPNLIREVTALRCDVCESTKFDSFTLNTTLPNLRLKPLRIRVRFNISHVPNICNALII